MKKWKRYIICSIILLLTLYLVPLPWWTNIKLEGIFLPDFDFYNSQDLEDTENAVFVLRGWRFHYLFRPNTFSGELYLQKENEKIGAQKVNSIINKPDQGRLSSILKPKNNIFYLDIGLCQNLYAQDHNLDHSVELLQDSSIYISKDFNKLLIINKTDTEAPIFIAPASTLDEAIKIISEIIAEHAHQ